MFKITIKNIKVKAKIGVSKLERKKNQLLFVTLSFKYNLLDKNKIDNIKYLKDYSQIIKFLKKFIEQSQYKTLEKLVIELKKELKKKFYINNIFLEVAKPEVAKKYNCDSISVSE